MAWLLRIVPSQHCLFQVKFFMTIRIPDTKKKIYKFHSNYHMINSMSAFSNQMNKNCDQSVRYVFDHWYTTLRSKIIARIWLVGAK